MKINKNVIGFIIIALFVISGLLFFMTLNKGVDSKITKKRTEELTVEVYKLAKPETESVIGFKKDDVLLAKKFIKNNAKSFSDTLHECDKCIISVEIDEITAIDDNTYDIYIRLINTFNDSVRSELPLRLVAGYHIEGLSVRVEPYLKSNFVK